MSIANVIDFECIFSDNNLIKVDGRAQVDDRIRIDDREGSMIARRQEGPRNRPFSLVSEIVVDR